MAPRTERGKLDYRERFQQIRAAEDLTVAEMAQALDWSPTTVQHAGRESSLSSELLAQFAKAFNVNLNWLLLGEGPQRIPVNPFGVPVYEGEQGHHRLRVYSSPASLLAEVVETNPEGEEIIIVVPSDFLPSDENPPKLVRVNDPLMRPILLPGCMVAVDTSPKAVQRKEELSGTIVLVRAEEWGGGACFRWLEKTYRGWSTFAETDRTSHFTPSATDTPPEVLGRVLWWFNKQDYPDYQPA